MSTNQVYEINIYASKVGAYYQDVKAFKNQLKTQKDMLKSTFENDADYATIQQEIKEKKKELAGIKNQLENLPAVKEIKQNIERLKEEIKDSQLGLFANLDAYSTQMKINTIELEGEVLHIHKNFKLSKS